MMYNLELNERLQNITALIRRIGQLAIDSDYLKSRLEDIEQRITSNGHMSDAHDSELSTEQIAVINETLDAVLKIEKEISLLEKRLAILKDATK